VRLPAFRFLYLPEASRKELAKDFVIATPSEARRKQSSLEFPLWIASSFHSSQ
jgi:hypothetical protein